MKFILSALILATASALPLTSLFKHTKQCGQYDSTNVAPYILYTNLWGQSDATSGSQCSGVNTLNGNSIAWRTSYSWAGTPHAVKSYSNVVRTMEPRQISSFKSLHTGWRWSYAGESMVADVSYDMFFSSTPDGANEYEVMIWVGAFGGAGPIGNAIATVNIGGYEWQLHKGPNGSTTVFSFVATTNQENFNSDLLLFFQYLVQHQGVSAAQYLKNVGAGTEPFVGSNAELVTAQYYVLPL